MSSAIFDIRLLLLRLLGQNLSWLTPLQYVAHMQLLFCLFLYQLFHLKANSDTLQNVIWAFGNIPPSSSSADATLQQHLQSGTFQLDLTKPISSNSTNGIPSPSSFGSSTTPLLYYQKLIVGHAILCVIGFLGILPGGAILARYLRTASPTWFRAHAILQGAIGESLILL